MLGPIHSILNNVYRLVLILSVLLVITNTYRYVTIDLKHKMLHFEEAHDLHLINALIKETSKRRWDCLSVC